MEFYEYPDGSGYEGRFTKCGICVLMKKLGLYDLTPALCRCYCDSDDISYAGLHPRLIWHRTKTLGRGDDRCDFCMKIVK